MDQMVWNFQNHGEFPTMGALKDLTLEYQQFQKKPLRISSIGEFIYEYSLDGFSRLGMEPSWWSDIDLNTHHHQPLLVSLVCSILFSVTVDQYSPSFTSRSSTTCHHFMPSGSNQRWLPIVFFLKKQQPYNIKFAWITSGTPLYSVMKTRCPRELECCHVHPSVDSLQPWRP